MQLFKYVSLCEYLLLIEVMQEFLYLQLHFFYIVIGSCFYYVVLSVCFTMQLIWLFFLKYVVVFFFPMSFKFIIQFIFTIWLCLYVLLLFSFLMFIYRFQYSYLAGFLSYNYVVVWVCFTIITQIYIVFVCNYSMFYTVCNVFAPIEYYIVDQLNIAILFSYGLLDNFFYYVVIFLNIQLIFFTFQSFYYVVRFYYVATSLQLCIFTMQVNFTVDFL